MASSQRDMVFCVRCPEAADAHLSKHNNDFAKCQKEYSPATRTINDEKNNKDHGQVHLHDIWWGFRPGRAPDSIELTQKATCIELLETAKAVFPIVWKKSPLSEDDVTNAVTAKRSSKFRNASITKDMLEAAVKLVHPPQTKKDPKGKQAVQATPESSLPDTLAGKQEASSALPSTAVTSNAGPSMNAATNAKTQIIDSTLAGSSAVAPSTAEPPRTPADEGQDPLPAMSTLTLQRQDRPKLNPAPSFSGQALPRSSLPSSSLPDASTAISRGSWVGATRQAAGPKGGTGSNVEALQFSKLSVDGNEAIRKIDAFVEKHVKESKGSKTEQGVINELALRRTFASGHNKREIVTNYMNISLPDKLFVYKVEMIRAKPTNAPNILVKRFADKIAVIESIATTTGHPLNTNITKWVTDGDLIWSRDRIFSSPRDDGNHQGPILVDSRPRVRYQNECGKVLIVEEVNFFEWNSINCKMSMSDLVQLPSPAAPGDNDSAVLLRGLNAFLTAHARRQSNITFTSGNKGYTMDNACKLSDCIDVVSGFSLSVRPGVDQLLMCSTLR